MRRSVSLEQRLVGHIPDWGERRLVRGDFSGAHHRGLHGRIQRRLDDTVLMLELDRLIYDIEVDAQHSCKRRSAPTRCAIIRGLRGVAQPGSAHRSGR
jgi:hypothetical protein